MSHAAAPDVAPAQTPVSALVGLLGPAGADLPRAALARALPRLAHRGGGTCQRCDWPGLSVWRLPSPGDEESFRCDPATGLVAAWDACCATEPQASAGRVQALNGHLLGLAKGHAPGAAPGLPGGFAAVLADRRTGYLWLIRDAHGRRPLFYASAPSGLAFASEIPALLTLTGAAPEIEPSALFGYLHRLETDAPQTLFTSIRQVPPGHRVRCSLRDGAVDDPERWDIPALPPERASSLAEAASMVRDRLVASVRGHVEGAPRVGVALSGGIDSSCLLAATGIVRGGGDGVHAFTFSPGGGAPGEEAEARDSARHAGVKWSAVAVPVQEIPAMVRRQAQRQGEPFQSPVVVAQQAVHDAAHAAGIVMMLEGHGGDELFGGGDAYRLAAAVSRWAGGERVAAMRQLMLLPARWRYRGLRWIAGAAVPDTWRRRWHRRARSRRGQDGILRWEWFAERGVVPPSPAARLPPSRALHHMLFTAQHGLRLSALLRFADRCSTAAGTEVRMPFLNAPLAEAALALPAPYLVAHDGTTKVVLRAALERELAPAARTRTAKLGFALPVVHWLAENRAWAEERIASVARLAFVRASAVHRQWERVLGRADEPAAYRVWRLVSLVEWMDVHGLRSR